MIRYLTLCFISLGVLPAHAQNIFSALHLNENRDYKFGKPAQIIETNTFYTSKSEKVTRNIKIFDPSGMLSVEENYDGDGHLTGRSKYENDTARNLIVSIFHQKWLTMGLNTDEQRFSYDEKGFLIRITTLDINGKISTVSEIKNNDRGDPVELTLYNGSHQIYGTEKAVYFYDKNLAINTFFNRDGRELASDSMKITFQTIAKTHADSIRYNSHGDELFYSSKNLNGSVTQYEVEYRYDKAGNCIDQHIYKVSLTSNGSKKRKIDRIFLKEIVYQ